MCRLREIVLQIVTQMVFTSAVTVLQGATFNSSFSSIQCWRHNRFDLFHYKEFSVNQLTGFTCDRCSNVS